MLIVKTPPIMAACPRGGFTRGSPWRRASPFLFLPTGPARAEFLFLRPPLKRRRIERHSHPPSPISLSLSLSLLFLPYPPFPPPFLYLPNQPPLFISSSTVSFHSFIYSFRIAPNLSTFVSLFAKRWKDSTGWRSPGQVSLFRINFALRDEEEFRIER